jgi:hypothetical protein
MGALAPSRLGADFGLIGLRRRIQRGLVLDGASRRGESLQMVATLGAGA